MPDCPIHYQISVAIKSLVLLLKKNLVTGQTPDSNPAVERKKRKT
jgi:hypothetical protein